jgi:hypothetical protein
MKCCEYGPWDHIHYPSFSPQLTNVTNKLEIYISLAWNGLTITNTPAIGPNVTTIFTTLNFLFNLQLGLIS